MDSTRPKKTGGGRTCAGCKNNQWNTKTKVPKVRFHKFPDPVADKKRFAKWCANVKKVRLHWNHPYNLGKTKGPWPNSVVCSDHFREVCYHPNSSRLKNDAIPTFATFTPTNPKGQRSTAASKRVRSPNTCLDENQTPSKRAHKSASSATETSSPSTARNIQTPKKRPAELTYSLPEIDVEYAKRARHNVSYFYIITFYA